MNRQPTPIAELLRSSQTTKSTSIAPIASQDDWRERGVAKWGCDSLSFLAKFNPDVQSYCARYPERCFSGDTPTLRQVELLYGRNVTESWLDVQISNFVKFAGVKGKAEFDSIMESVLQVIADNFWWLKISELMLFFQMCKAGKYGHFYGTVDAMVITEALQGFCTYRTTQLSRLERQRHNEEQQQQAAQREEREHRGELLSREEWNELSWLFNMGCESIYQSQY